MPSISIYPSHKDWFLMKTNNFSVHNQGLMGWIFWLFISMVFQIEQNCTIMMSVTFSSTRCDGQYLLILMVSLHQQMIKIFVIPTCSFFSARLSADSSFFSPSGIFGMDYKASVKRVISFYDYFIPAWTSSSSSSWRFYKFNKGRKKRLQLEN